jgi:hypothetical protein
VKPRHLVAIAFVLVLASPSAFALRCGSNIVTQGAQDFQVRARCGDPFYSDRYVTTEVFGTNAAETVYRDVQYDVWYYNFGPRQFMRRFVFRDGVLAREESLGYGVDEIGDDCNLSRDYRGASVGELVAHCGEPASRRVNDDGVVRRGPDFARIRDVRREQWIYDFGDDRTVRMFNMTDGRVDGGGLINR